MIEGFVDSQGIKIHYLSNRFDVAKPASLLFVPGVMMPAWIWEKQLSYFSKKYNVVAMDPRSQGDSDLSLEGHYAFSRSQDIKAVVDALKLKPLILIGWSLGVPEVINYTSHFGAEGLIGLVLVDGLMGIDSSVPFYHSAVEYWTQFQVDRISKTKEFVKMMFKQKRSEEYLEKLTRFALRTPTNTVMTLILNYLLQDFRPLLPRINVPTMIATIECPRLGYMQSMQSMIPQSRLEIIQEADHALFVDQPEVFNRLLESFIEDILYEKKL